MSLVARAVRLDARERRTALRAAAWLALAGVALRVMPFRALSRLIAGLPVRHGGEPLDPVQCARAVQRAARLVPWTTCLAQSLAAACLLRRDGVSSVLSIGARLDDRRAFRAHAWLESGGLVVAGSGEAAGQGVLVREEFPVNPNRINSRL